MFKIRRSSEKPTARLSPQVVSQLALEQVTGAIDSIEALASVRTDYIASVFVPAPDRQIISTNSYSETAKAYIQQVDALARLTCIAALKLAHLPDELPGPEGNTLTNALTNRLLTYEASRRLIDYGRYFTDVTNTDNLQRRMMNGYLTDDYMTAVDRHAQDVAEIGSDLAGSSSVTDRTLYTVTTGVEAATKFEEIIVVQEYDKLMLPDS
jgi:hypothetical protein